MKKYRLILLVLLLPAICFAKGVYYYSGLDSPGGSGDDCASGTYQSAYDGDHSSGAGYICYNSGASSEDGTTKTADVINSSYVEFNAADESLSWTITGDGAVDDSQGTLCLEAYFVTTMPTNSGSIIEIYYDGSNYITLRADGNNTRILCYHSGAGTSNWVAATGIGADTWESICYSWRTGGGATGDHAASSDGGSTWDDEDSEDLDDFSSDPTTYTIGEKDLSFAVNQTVRIRNVSITSGYKDSAFLSE